MQATPDEIGEREHAVEIEGGEERLAIGQGEALAAGELVRDRDERGIGDERRGVGGDARIDAAGNVAITGRNKDIINRGGVKFNPRDVENLLDGHPQILQSAIVPMPDPVLGERACAFATLRPGAAEPTLEELCAYLLAKGIAKNKLPERLVVVPEMPLTPTRKIIKGRLKLPA
ncbi:MAG: hypothetical protein HUU19_16145 [Phycisphaerales bacterium]|nr:hypothetical protein [Phycisphaerales bacterium]